jgi:hypothetical protein
MLNEWQLVIQQFIKDMRAFLLRVARSSCNEKKKEKKDTYDNDKAPVVVIIIIQFSKGFFKPLYLLIKTKLS